MVMSTSYTYGLADATAIPKPIVSCLTETQSGFSFQVPDYLDYPGKAAINCVFACYAASLYTAQDVAYCYRCTVAGLCVSRSGAKTVQPIKIPFGMWILGAQGTMY